jgi:GTP-dependent phosphoenolpyruvate carboxykinase
VIVTASAIQGLHPAPTRHAGLIAWVEQIAALTRPARVHWCDGSEAEKAAIVADLIGKGTLSLAGETDISPELGAEAKILRASANGEMVLVAKANG